MKSVQPKKAIIGILIDFLNLLYNQKELLLLKQAVSWSVTKIGTALNSPPGMDRTIRGQMGTYPKGNAFGKLLIKQNHLPRIPSSIRTKWWYIW